MDIRIIEKTNKWGYIFYIKYNGTKFYCFDEMKGKKTVKGQFKNIMDKLNFTWAKGIQQGGRTDARVSANENILYVSSNFKGNLLELQKKFNELSDDNLKITMIKKTFPNLDFPNMVSKRCYIYKYPKNKILRDVDEIRTLCNELSGTFDVSKFTDKKGLQLKEKIREVEIQFIDGNLVFIGNSFMPKQVRIMSGYILTGEKEPLEGKYLTLDKIILLEKLKEKIIVKAENVTIDNVEEIEKTADETLYIFYVKKHLKGEIIGKNGKNIKQLKKIYGQIVVKER